MFKDEYIWTNGKYVIALGTNFFDEGNQESHEIVHHKQLYFHSNH